MFYLMGPGVGGGGLCCPCPGAGSPAGGRRLGIGRLVESHPYRPHAIRECQFAGQVIVRVGLDGEPTPGLAVVDQGVGADDAVLYTDGQLFERTVDGLGA